MIQVSKKQLAQNILKNQKFILKYKNLDAQLQNTTFEYYFCHSRLQSMSTMDQMSNVMNGMANIMGDAKNKINIEQFNKNMRTYATEKERMEMVNEMIQDSMDGVEDEIDDTDVDGLISNMEADVKAKKQKQI